MKKLKLTIDGMHCASCASNVERSLKNVKGVGEISVSVMTKKGFVEAEDDVKTEDIEKAIERVGFKLKSIEEQNV